MATIPTKPGADISTPVSAASVPSWPRGENPASSVFSGQMVGNHSGDGHSPQDDAIDKPSQRDALQALLAFSALHEQVRRRKALAARHRSFDAGAPLAEFEESELFVLDEVLQLVAERAVAITGADGLAIALAEDNEIVLRASAGTVRPDVGARIDRDSAFSGASFRMAQAVNCDDTETDPRVNVQACRRLGARSMVAVPLCGRRRVIGLLEAFSSWPFGFNDSDVRNLSLLAELVVSALKPEDEDRFAEAAEAAETSLNVPPPTAAESARIVTPVVAPPAQPLVAPPPVPSKAPAPVVESKTAEPKKVESKPAESKAVEPKTSRAPIPAATTTIAPAPRALPVPAPAIPVAPAQKATSLLKFESPKFEPPEFEPPISAETGTARVLTLGHRAGTEQAPRPDSADLPSHRGRVWGRILVEVESSATRRTNGDRTVRLKYRGRRARCYDVTKCIRESRGRWELRSGCDCRGR